MYLLYLVKVIIKSINKDIYYNLFIFITLCMSCVEFRVLQKELYRCFINILKKIQQIIIIKIINNV